MEELCYIILKKNRLERKGQEIKLTSFFTFHLLRQKLQRDEIQLLLTLSQPQRDISWEKQEEIWIIIAMDRLVTADVKEVEIVFKKGQKCISSFRLSNLMHTMSVAVCLATSNPSIFSINQQFSVLPPLSSSSYSVSLSLPSDQPLIRAPPDTITVRSCMLPIGRTYPDDLRTLFSKPGSQVFKDATLPIFFVGHQVLESLISRHIHVRDLGFYLSKAVSGCSKSQLTAFLVQSISSGEPDIVSSLIDAGADVNAKNLHGEPILSMAVLAGNIEVLNVLIASGCVIDESSGSVLQMAAGMNRVDLIQLLCSSFKSIDVNSVDPDGRTAIHVAAVHGHVDVIRYCISAGGNPEITDRNRWTPLHGAAAEGHLESVECLLECSNVKYVLNSDGKTAFALAADNGHSNLFDLLHLGDALNRAARQEDVHRLKSCLSEGAKVNGRDQNGWTALHRAAFKGRIESVKFLLEYGADVDLVDDAGYTPLHCAVEAGHMEVAFLLLDNGAKANLKSFRGLGSRNLESLRNLHPLLLH